MAFDPPTLETIGLDLRHDGVAVLTMNRPDRANSQTVTMFEEYATAALALRDCGARALVVRGRGPRRDRRDHQDGGTGVSGVPGAGGERDRRSARAAVSCDRCGPRRRCG